MRHFLAILLATGLIALSSSALETEDLQVRHAKGWPNWRGPYCSGSASPCGEEVVESSADAKLVWRSEERQLPTSYWTAAGWIEASGFGDVAVVDGRVYMYYYRRAGNIINRKRYDRIYAHWDTEERRRFWSSLDADDIVICIDAATGRTLWKTFFWGKGLVYKDMGTGFGPLTSPCVADGKVYTIGGSGRVYCVDAKTGRPLWESDLGKEFERVDYWLRKADRQQPNGFYDSCPIYADGVLACNDHSHTKRDKKERAGLVGFDGKTGRKLWVVPDCIHGGPGVSPVRWTHKGKEYFIASHRERAVCIEPKTGRILWEIRGQLHQGGTPAVCEDYLILGGTTNTHGEYKVLPDTTGLACYRITPKGCKRVWRMSPLNYAKGNQTSPVIQGGYVYVGMMGVMGNKGGFTCIDLATGNVRGSAQLGAGYTPVACDGRVFTTTGVMMHAVPGFSKNLDLPRFGKPEPYSHATYTACAVADGRLYVRGRNSIYCYDLRKSIALADKKMKETPVDPKTAHIPPWMRQAEPKQKEEEDRPKRPPLPATIAELVEELRDPHLARREQASLAILKRDAAGEMEAVPALVRLAVSDNWPAQTAAVGILELMGPNAHGAVDILSQALLTALEAKRRSDVELLLPALARIDPDTVKALVPRIAGTLADKDPDVALLACVALQTIGPNAKDAEPALTALLNHKDVLLASAAARALAHTRPGARAIPALGRCLGRNNYDLTVQALKALCAAGFTAKEAIPDVISVLDSMMADGELLAVLAQDLLINIGPGAAAPLIAQLKKAESDESIATAIRGLALLGTDACDAAPLLQTIAADRENANHHLAQDALKKVRVE
ncbi:PQQ-binding-like beta-propeller repeat protein [Verrucomicrobiota bacterium]